MGGCLFLLTRDTRCERRLGVPGPWYDLFVAYSWVRRGSERNCARTWYGTRVARKTVDRHDFERFDALSRSMPHRHLKRRTED